MSKKSKEFIKKIKNVRLPKSLQQLFYKRIYTAIVLSAVCVLVSIVMRSFVFLTGLLISVYLIYIGIALRYQYASGLINEYTGVCVCIYQHRNSTKIVLLSDNKNSHVFTIPGKNVFFEKVNYVIYTLNNNNNVGIAFSEI